MPTFNDQQNYNNEGETSMSDRPIFSTLLAAMLFCIICFPAASIAQQDGCGRYYDKALGVAFAKAGTVEKIDTATFRIALQSSETSAPRSALAQLSATDRLFVDLPGSYGGRLYYDEPSASQLMKNRMLEDTVLTGQQNFHRDYWVVYAGMGMWEGVINCYTREAGRYYIVSLIQTVQAGKPGEEADGKPLAAADLQGKVLQSLRDTTNVIVNEFTTILHSVQVQQ